MRGPILSGRWSALVQVSGKISDTHSDRLFTRFRLPRASLLRYRVGMATSPLPSAPSEHRTPFVIGITGHMKLPDGCEADLKARFRSFYRWLRGGREAALPELGHGLNLRQTPITVLTSLAPGVDQIAAQVAREEEFGFRVSAPLAFPMEQYLRSSTFDGYPEEVKENARKLAHDSFFVPLACEAEPLGALAENNRESQLLGQAGKVLRHARQRAAGEYVAAYCDILLAVTDLEGFDKLPEEPARFVSEVDYEPGSPSIVRVRRRGITPGLLHVEPALPWVDSGPVVYLPWPKQGASPPSNEGKFSFFPKPVNEATELEQPNYESLYATAELVERFNSSAGQVDLEQKARAEMRSMLAVRKDAPLPTLPDGLEGSLLRIAGVRNRSKLHNRAMDAKVKSWRDWFLFLAFLAALLLQFQENWSRDSGEGPALATFRTVCYLGALVCGLAAIFALFMFRAGRWEEEQIDSRCIAEGLRVQFYWTTVGLGASAASEYLLRQRGAIRWIINAVSAAAAPYDRRRDWSSVLTPRQCKALFDHALRGWIEAPGKAGQLSYYSDSVQEMEREYAQLHLQGWAYLVAGVQVSVAMFCLSWMGLNGTGQALLNAPGAITPVATTFLSLCCVSGLALLRWLLALRDASPQNSPALWLEDAPMETDGVIAQCWAAFMGAHPSMPERRREQLKLLRTVLIVLLIATPITILILALSEICGSQFPSLPDAGKMRVVAKNVLFALSARAFLASSLRFHTENMRNYGAMRQLFAEGAKRIRALVNTLPDSDSALSADEAVKVSATVVGIQDLFYALGREALSEHAEWLHFHRDRPTTPSLPQL